MREMKESGIEWIGEIPKDWNIYRTKNLYYKHKDIVGERVDCYERLALTLNGVIKRSKEDANGLQPENFSGYQILKKGDLVFKLIDLENVSTSRVGLSPYEGLVSPAYIALSPRKNSLSRFGEYYFLSMWHREIFNHIGDDGVRSSLNASDLLNIPYICPNIDKQQIIADFLDDKCAEIDDVIIKSRDSIEEYKKLKQSVITQAVTKGIIPNRQMKDSGIEWIGKIPFDWELCRLRNMGLAQNGISKGGEFFGKGYPFVSYGDVYKNITLPEKVNGLIQSNEDERKKYSVERGDIFFTRTSETIEEVGFSSVCLETIPNATFAGFLIRVRPFNDKLVPEFSKYYFRNSLHRIYLCKEMNLVTRASLGQDLLKSMRVLVPPKSEQEEIIDYLDEKCSAIDELIAKKEQFIVEMENYKKSLIYEYVTGKKEVQ